MGSADPVAMSDRGQALNVRTEHASERARLGLAQLRELGSDVRDRAMVLTDLRPARGALGTCSVSVLAQRLSKGRDTLRLCRVLVHLRSKQLAQRLGTMLREAHDRVIPAGIA